MVRDFLNSAVQKKYFLMFFTCAIYIIGLGAYFSGYSILFSAILLILGIFAILKNYISPKLILFWYLTFFFAFFNASFRTKDFDMLYQIAPQQAKIEGQIVSIPTEVNGKTKFLFNVYKISYSGYEKSLKAKTLVTTYGHNFNIGDYYQVEGKLRTPVKPTNPSQFDYGSYLKRFDVFTLFYANNFKPIEKHLSLKWKFLQGLNNTRNDIIQAHAKCLKSPNLELLGGVVFGDDAISPPEDLKTSFQHSGLLHLLAASGMNVALIYGIWFFLLRKLRVPYNITVLSGIFVVIFYTLMTGMGASVLRAAIMLIFILIGKLLDRDAHSISLLSFVALLMLIYNPSYINDVSFQLSFIVTFGLLVMAPVVFEHVKFMPNWLSGALLIPVIAQIWIAPVQMYYFNSFSLYSVFANICVLPFITVISFGGFISSVLALIKPLAGGVCYLFDFVLNPILTVIVWISDFFAHLPHSLISTPQPSDLKIVLYYGMVLSLTLFLKFFENKKLLLSSVILFLMLILSCIKIPSHNFETIAFDVGNADAFLVKTPQNKYFIIDSGKMSYQGGKTQAKMIILAYLKDIGVKNIEGLILTHFDSDHAGGALDLIQNLNIKKVYVNSLTDKSNLAQKIYAVSENKIKQAKNNEIIYKEGKFVIKDFISNLRGEELENENSIITLVSDGQFDELFMGDAGIIGFEKIQKYLPSHVEILKVGHHGAKNVINKSFLDKISPDAAIISTGLNNYGHPNGVTLDILKSHKVKTLRTDRQNSIKISEKNNVYHIYSYNNGKYLPVF